jgi:hypothetical protein
MFIPFGFRVFDGPSVHFVVNGVNEIGGGECPIK